MQRVVGITSPYAGYRSLVAQDRVYPARVFGCHHQALELPRERLRPESSERTVVSGGQHPAFRWVPYSFTRTDGRRSKKNRTTAPLGRVVLAGSSMSIRPPWDR